VQQVQQRNAHSASLRLTSNVSTQNRNLNSGGEKEKSPTQQTSLSKVQSEKRGSIVAQTSQQTTFQMPLEEIKEWSRDSINIINMNKKTVKKEPKILPSLTNWTNPSLSVSAVKKIETPFISNQKLVSRLKAPTKLEKLQLMRHKGKELKLELVSSFIINFKKSHNYLS